jgi:hypothetical protein
MPPTGRTSSASTSSSARRFGGRPRSAECASLARRNSAAPSVVDASRRIPRVQEQIVIANNTKMAVGCWRKRVGANQNEAGREHKRHTAVRGAPAHRKRSLPTRGARDSLHNKLKARSMCTGTSLLPGSDDALCTSSRIWRVASCAPWPPVPDHVGAWTSQPFATKRGKRSLCAFGFRLGSCSPVMLSRLLIHLPLCVQREEEHRAER